jgi:hypothetical protein
MLRRQFELLPEDEQLLNDHGLPWETVVDGSHWVLVHDFPTHEGYDHKTVTAAIRLETGYPSTPLDMVYFNPPLSRLDGQGIGATQATQEIAGVAYQRWSRHRTEKNQWNPNFDNLETHIALIEYWLEREFET